MLFHRNLEDNITRTEQKLKALRQEMDDLDREIALFFESEQLDPEKLIAYSTNPAHFDYHEWEKLEQERQVSKPQSPKPKPFWLS